MANKWLTHIKKTMKLMKSKGTYEKGKGLKQVIMAAKKTWHSAKKGGGDGLVEGETPPSLKPAAKDEETEPVKAGRRRKTRRQRHSRRR
jgi:hypothetical protein